VGEGKPEVSPLSGEEKGILRLCARVASATDVGRRRRNNQDNHLILPLDSGGPSENIEAGLIGIDSGSLLVAIADGMGGHFGGEVASRVCVGNLAKEIVTLVHPSGNGSQDLSSALRAAVDAAHHAVFAHAQTYAQSTTMGTTLTAVLLHGAHADLAQVGDSRAYLFRDGILVMLTQDQTIGNQMRKKGQDPSEVDAHIQDMLVQAVGSQPTVDIIMTAVDFEPHDFLLLCSDGLYNVVPPVDIAEILERHAGLQEKAALLVARANEGGGPDNITVILAQICQAETTN